MTVIMQFIDSSQMDTLPRIAQIVAVLRDLSD